MSKLSSTSRRRRLRSQRGQAVTEYGAVLAFTASLIALTIMVPGLFGNSLLASFNAIVGQLARLVAQAS